ncbi:acyltransferase family protein [Flavobacterium sp. FZUC8N2.13]|uniref:acyltransferase family protein n=1 Tax=Flavobacterium zubiriense TaxID=3138075 RepID=UPI00358EFC2A
MQQQRIFGLDFARALAIVLVLLSHFFKKIDVLGFFGVEFFFALSGYLLGQIMWRVFNNDTSFKIVFNFWQRRWFRTLPNYFLFLFLMLLFHIYIKKDFIEWNVIKEYFYFGQNLLKESSFFYGISWSLCVEEWFYLLFPIPIFVFRKLGFKNINSFCFTILLFYGSCFIIKNYLLATGIHNLRMVALGRLDSITSGVLVAVIILNCNEKKINALALLGVLLFILSLGLMLFSNKDYSENILLFFLIPLSFSLMLPKIERLKFPENKFIFIRSAITNLSLWSYSIYLSHIPILFTLYYLTDSLNSSLFMKLSVKILGFILTILVSKWLFVYFETPLTNKRPKELRPTKLVLQKYNSNSI